MSVDLRDKRFKKLRAFTIHGAHFHDTNSSQAVGDCPFCFKEKHFYVNYTKLLWDCKVCSKKGNLQTFIKEINKRNLEGFDVKARKKLSKDRKLPTFVFNGLEIGFDGIRYTLPIRNHEGKIQDLRHYKPGQKVMSTSQCSLGIFGLEKLLASKKEQVFLCEGEWDTIAMQWLLNKNKYPGIAVCTPGCTTFREEWANFFKGRDVLICYDHDTPGYKGQVIAAKYLNGKAKTLSFIHWPQNKQEGYDLRDLIIEKAIDSKKPKTTLRLINKYMKPEPLVLEDDEDNEPLTIVRAPDIVPNTTLEDAHNILKKNLHQPDIDVFDVVLACMTNNLFDTTPIWMFIVAPPSSGKTEVINTFKYCGYPYDSMAYYSSKFTPHSLISGMTTKNGDPSLLKKFENNPMTLFLKDFSSVMGLRDNDKDEIYSSFRDIYDGYCSKDFGNGVERKYNDLNFSFIACCTPEIYDEAHNFNALGERFGKIILNVDQSIPNMIKMMDKADENLKEETKVREEMAIIVYSYLKALYAWIEKNNIPLPGMKGELKEAIQYLCIYSSKMRGNVSRDKFKKDFITSKPSTENPIRLYKMLSVLACNIALHYKQKDADLNQLRVIKKIALDTVNQRDEEILRIVYKKNYIEQNQCTKRDIFQNSIYTPYTVNYILQSMVLTGVLEVQKIGRRDHYQLTPFMKEVVDKAKLYSTEEELNRINADELKEEEKVCRTKKLKIKKRHTR